jgi:TonB family protein
MAFLVLLGGSFLYAQDTQQNATGSSGLQDRVYEQGEGVTPPKPISTPNAEYTDQARRKKISGTVLVDLIVNADGTVRSVSVLQKLEPSLDKQAVKAVRQWTFQPATKDGEPVPIHLKAEVSFRIR